MAWGRCGEPKGAAEKPVRKNTYDTAESGYHYRAGSPDFAGKNIRLKNAILPGFVNVVLGLAKAETHIWFHRLSSTSDRSMSSQPPANEPQRLDFAALPLDKNGPHGNAWGRWGTDDQLGTLNFLTDDVVAKAVSDCVKTGQRTSLK